jgi:diamine N-acetyltransferase
MITDGNSGKIHVRYATGNDAPLLAQLGTQTFYETYAADISAEDMAAFIDATFSPEKQAAELATGSNRFLIAEAETAAIGYAKLSASKPPAGDTRSDGVELARIYVLKEWLGRGVGAMLMQACLTEAEKVGYGLIWLGVWEHNPRALAFYKKWGFEEVGVQTFQLGNELQTDLLLQRQIANSRQRRLADS